MTYKIHKLILLLLSSIFLLNSCEESVKKFDPVDYVSTLVGTASSFEFSTGNTYPAVALPWGMNFWTPQTGKMGDGWIYTYQAHKIRGFRQTHQPSPWINDYGQFSIMPLSNSVKGFDEDSRASWFSHKAEVAKPYYYSVYLADFDIFAEMTASSRAASLRFTYPQCDSSYLLIDAFGENSKIEVDSLQKRIWGYNTRNSGSVPKNFKNYFVIECDKAFKLKEIKTLAPKTKNEHTIAVLEFPTTRGEKLNLSVASSFISDAQALENLKELGSRNFDSLKIAHKAVWNKTLSRIQVESNNLDNLRTFYSCLYRSVLFPRSFYEKAANGEILHYSPYNGKIEKGYMFTDTGFWDTFRSLLPLDNLIYPDISSKIQAGLVNAYKESSFLPEWASPGHRNCMIGNNSASVVADAYIKGIKNYDANILWQAVTHDAHAVDPQVPSTGRLAWQQYDSLGYVPCDIGVNESAARTLEYAYDDWCIYQFGKALGRPESELAPYKKAAENYKNVFDPEYKWMVGRKANGQFARPFNPLKWGGDFTEGNSLHYTWSVFQDPLGLQKLMGGEKAYEAKLDTIFSIPPHYDDSYYGFPIHEIREMQVMNMGNYAHGNQPIQHMLYMYAWTKDMWKAQKRIREVMSKFYNAQSDGYCGDEDNGQTSSWYVFSALGFYPLCPGSDQYVIGSPLFKKVILHLNNGRKFEILAPHNSPKNVYVEKLCLDGRLWDKNYITHEEITKGGRMDFIMSDKPNKKRVATPEAFPYSFSKKNS